MVDLSKHFGLNTQGDPFNLISERFSDRGALTQQLLEEYTPNEHSPLLKKFGDRTLQNPKFIHGFESYQRAVQAVQSRGEAAVESELRKTF